MVGVDVPARHHSDPIVLLQAMAESTEFQPGDILVFGDGRYSALDVQISGIEINAPIAAQLGHERHSAVVLDNRKVIVFHEPEATLSDRLEQPLQISNQEYTAILDRNFADQEDYSVEIYLNHQAVTTFRLVNTLTPLRDFALNAGQELLMLPARMSGGKFKQSTINTFEPTITANKGSVRLFLHPAKPRQIPLLVKPSEPLRIMVDALRAASEGDAKVVASLLTERFLGGEVLIERLKRVADVAAKHGDLIVRSSDNDREILVDRTVAATLVAGLEIAPERDEERTGTIYDLALSRYWLRLQCHHNDRTEEWTLSYTKDIDAQMHNLPLPRKVRVLFTTRTPPESVKGKGKIKSIVTIG
ncbi:MAG: hypothetical protein IT328_24060 [Caldilineaceae bacterium]|nr:hypothetical protein [Caldilineaceae bacterium]